MPALLWVLAGSGVAVWMAILAYAILNQSHHTGWEPFFILYLYVPLFGMGVFSVCLPKRPLRLRWPGLILLVIGLVGVLTVIYLDQTNRLVQYDHWVRRGMP